MRRPERAQFSTFGLLGSRSINLAYRQDGRIGSSWQVTFIIGKGETMAEAEGEILTLEEVAAYLKAGKRTVYRLAAEGKLPAFKLGGTWRFRRSDLDEWIAANLTNKESGAGD